MGHMSKIYDTNIIYFVLKIFLFHYCLILLSPSLKSRYSPSENSVRENVSGYAFGLIVIVIEVCAFTVVSSSTKLVEVITILLLAKPCFLSNIPQIKLLFV